MATAIPKDIRCMMYDVAYVDSLEAAARAIRDSWPAIHNALTMLKMNRPSFNPLLSNELIDPLTNLTDDYELKVHALSAALNGLEQTTSNAPESESTPPSQGSGATLDGD